MFADAPRPAAFDGSPSDDVDPAEALRQLAREVGRALLRYEHQTLRAVDREDLARRLHVSPASLYAYLKGTTLPNSEVFDSLLQMLGVTGPEAGRLSTLRDGIEVARRIQRGRKADREPARDDSPATLPLPLPRQLPPAGAHFVGRAKELERLDSLQALEDDGSWTVLATVSGPPGIGKTALALYWAHQVKARFPDGQLHVDLRGFDRQAPADPGVVLQEFLQALGIGAAAVPVGLEAKAALFRSVIADRRVLIVADNARSADQVRPLLPGTPSCHVVVTSRDRLDSLAVREGAVGLALDALPPDEAMALLDRRVGTGRLDAEPGAAAFLVESCAGLPLALTLTASRAATVPEQRLEVLAQELRSVDRRLDVIGLGEGDLDLRAVFAGSYGQLAETPARLFRLLGAHAGPTADGYACAALLGVPEPPRAVLRQLQVASLITEPTPGRYALHDLLRLYASELAAESKTAGADLRRVLDYYLDAATLAEGWLRFEEGPDTATPRHGSGALPSISTYEQAVAWFDAEIDTLQSTIAEAHTCGFAPYAWLLARVCTVYLRRTGRREQRALVHQIALEAATRSGDRGARAVSLRLLADALARLDHLPKASLLLSEARSECVALGAHADLLATHLSTVRVEEATGRHAVALDHARQALVLAERLGEASGIADGLTALAEQLATASRPAEALTLARRALAHTERLGNAEAQADILMALGGIHRALTATDEARAAYERSLAIDRRLGDRYWESRALEQLADLALATGDLAGFRSRLSEALAVLESLGHPHAERVRARLGAG